MVLVGIDYCEAWSTWHVHLHTHMIGHGNITWRILHLQFKIQLSTFVKGTCTMKVELMVEHYTHREPIYIKLHKLMTEHPLKRSIMTSQSSNCHIKDKVSIYIHWEWEWWWTRHSHKLYYIMVGLLRHPWSNQH